MASPGDVAAQPRDALVVRALAEHLAALARMQALGKNKAGDYEGARGVLQEAANAIAALANGDAAVLAIVESLRDEAGEFAACMAPLEVKRRHFAQSAVLRSRNPEGRARRRG